MTISRFLIDGLVDLLNGGFFGILVAIIVLLPIMLGIGKLITNGLTWLTKDK